MLLRSGTILLNALFLCAITLFSAIPDVASSHPDDHAGPASEASGHDTSAHPSGDAPAGHCHPGLDCFTAAVFIVPAEIAPPAFASRAGYVISHQMVDDVPTSLDLPPPRPES